MVIDKNIEKDTYWKLVDYAFQKCDTISLTKQNDQHESEHKKIMDIIMSMDSYSTTDILNNYSGKFLEDMFSQFKNNISIFDDDYQQRYELDFRISKEESEKFKEFNRYHAITGSIKRLVYEKLTESWINRNRNSIIKVTNHYITELSGKKFLYNYIYYIKMTKEIQEEMLKKQSLFDWVFPTSLEDLCIFKNGYCWLYSVAHEEILDIYCENEEEYNYLKSI